MDITLSQAIYIATVISIIPLINVVSGSLSSIKMAQAHPLLSDLPEARRIVRITSLFKIPVVSVVVIAIIALGSVLLIRGINDSTFYIAVLVGVVQIIIQIVAVMVISQLFISKAQREIEVLIEVMIAKAKAQEKDGM